MLSRTLIPYFMEFLTFKELISFSSINYFNLHCFKAFFKIDILDTFKYCCKMRYLKMIDFLSDKNYCYTYAILFCTEYGHKDLVEMYIEKSQWKDKQKFIKAHKSLWDTSMAHAAKGNHKDLVKYFIKLGANNWRLASAFSNSSEMDEYLIESSLSN